MRTTKKNVSLLIAATFVSGLLTGSGLAASPGQTVVDGNGRGQLNPEYAQEVNEVALQAPLRRIAAHTGHRRSATDGDANGNEPLSIHYMQIINQKLLQTSHTR